MRVKRYAIAAIAAFFALLSAAAGAADQCDEGLRAEAVEVQRQAFNQAMEAADLERISAVLAEDVVLITGTDSHLFSGRQAQLDLWRGDFASNDRLVYVRTSECIQVSERFPIAHERGRWRGERNEGADFAAGLYSAKWRHDGEAWRLEAEVFMTEACSASICPDTEPVQ